MMRVSVFLLFLLVMKLPSHSQITIVETDSILQEGVHNLIYEFYENFGLTDSRGVYHEIYEDRFSNLFIDEGVITNLFEGTESFNKQVRVSDYIDNIKQEYKNKIIRPASSLEYNIESLRYQDNEYESYLVDVNLPLEILIFDKETFSEENQLTTNLSITITAQPQQSYYKIINVLAFDDHYLSLTFRVLTKTREPAIMQPVDFEYHTSEGNTIQRKRIPNSDGEISLTDVPSNAYIKIYDELNGIDAFLANESLRVKNWNEIPDINRILLTNSDVGFHENKRKNKFYIGFSYPFQMLHSTLSFNGDSIFNKSQMTHISGNISFSTRYSRNILGFSSFGISAGLGLDYTPWQFETTIPSEILTENKNCIDCDNQYSPIGKIESETFKMNLLSFPLLLTLNYNVNNRFFRGLDLLGVARYTLSNNIDYVLAIKNIDSTTQPNVKQSSQYNYLFSNDSRIIQEGNISHLTGTVKQKARFSLEIEAAFNFNIYRDVIHFNYRLAYHVGQMGHNEPVHYFRPEGSNLEYLYYPVLITREFVFSHLMLGGGLSFRF